MKSIDVDIIVPSFDGFEQTICLIEAFKTQSYVNIVNIVVPITVSNYEKDELLRNFCNSDKRIKTFDVTQSFFSHSLTRQRAITKYCTSDIVILFSQDVILRDRYSFYNLVRDIANKKCAYAFGRQICTNHSIERYIREKNYPQKSYFVSNDDIERMQTMAFFSSDAFSAIDRNVFIDIGGYNNMDVIINEDMLYSYYLLKSGFVKKYCADAVVEHSHRFTLRQIYRRYYKVGRFYKQVEIFNQYKNNHAGLKLALFTLRMAIIHLNIPVIIRWLPDMMVRFFAFRKGRRYTEK